MKKGKLSKILAIVLTLVMVVGLMSPISMLTTVAVENEEEPFCYAPTAFSKEMLAADGWVVTTNDGTNITTRDESVFASDSSFWWRFNSDGSIQGQGNDCEGPFGKAQQALTYTGKYLDEFNITFATNAAAYNYRASFSIGVQTPGEYYKDETSPKNVITVTTNPNDSTIIGIDTFEVKGAAIEGGTATCKVVPPDSTPSMIYWNVKVYNNTLYIAGNNYSYEFKLNDNYIGGYFSIISPNSYTKYYPTTINTIIDSDSEYKLYSYSPNQLKTDGWVATKNNGGTITTYDDNVYKTGTTFYWSCSMSALGARIKGEGSDCEGNLGKAYQNLTYTRKEYKNFNMKFKTDAGGYHTGIAFSIGVKNAGEIYLDSNSPSNVITAKTNFVSSGDITQLTVSGAAVEGGSKTFTIAKDSNNLFNWDVTVKGKKLYITCNSATMELNLNDNYVGGYVQLSLPNSYSNFYPITVKEIEYDENEYFTTLNSLSDLEAEGWKASYSSNPSAGEPFVDCEVTDYLLNPASGGIQRNAKDFDHSSIHGYKNWKDPFYYMSALTYTGQQYKYFTLSVDYRLLDPTVPWPIVSFGQQSATAEMFYNPINVNANPAGGETPIGVYPELEGSINIKGKNVSATRKDAQVFLDESAPSVWHTLTITVTPGKVDVSIDNGIVTHSTTLSDNYTGGYISLMLGHSYSMFKNLKINKIDYDYSSTLSNLNTLEEEGWKASYSSNPSAGEPFVDCEVTDYLLNPASGGIQRNAKDFDHSSIHGYGNWKDPFYYMSALTYTGQQYKYFTLSVDYRLADPTVPWPIVSFGQQSATAEMFYNPINVNANPAGGETPIGVYPELEGSINIKGKNVSATRKDAQVFLDESAPSVWHTLTITVTPGKVDVSIDNGVVTHSTTLSSSYSGGYVSLMLGHSYSMFKNFKINTIDDEFAGDVNLDSEINSLDLTAIRQVLLGAVEDLGNSDVNRDTLVDIRDLVSLKKQLVSIENESITQTSDLSDLDSVKKKIIL